MKLKEEISLEKYKKQIYMYLAFWVTIILILILGYALSFIPDTLDVEYIQSNYIKSLNDFVAEKSESIQYIILTILFPVLYFFSYNILKKIYINYKYTKLIYNIIFSLTFIIFLALSFIIIINKYTSLYIPDFKNILFYLFFLAIVLILCFYKFFNKTNIVKYINYLVCGFLILILSYLYINPSFAQNAYLAHHTDAYYYPILKINSGLTPYIDFNPLYGCYSYFYSFIQTIINNDSIFSFSIIVATLVSITLINLFIVINKLIKNKLICFLTFFSISFYMIIVSFTNSESPYLQYMPHRTISISILLLYISIYLKYRIKLNKNILQLIGFLICSFSLFWNIETGLIVLIVWIGFLIYEILFFNSFKKLKTYLYILKIFVLAILSVVFTLLLINILGYMRTGELTSIYSIISSQTLFYGTGFYMIKMTLFNPWIILIAIYLIGLTTSMRKLYLFNENSQLLFNKYSFIFAISILGIGIFSYYQGRSHNAVFSSVLYPGFILLGIFTDMTLKKIHYIRSIKSKVINIVILLPILTTLIICSYSSLYTLWSNKVIHLYLDKQNLSKINILSNLCPETDNKIDFIYIYESLYYKKYNLTDNKKFPANVDIFTYKDCKNIIDFLKNTNNSVIITASLYEIIEDKYKEDIQYIDNKFTYEKIHDNDYIILTPLEN